MPDNDSINCMLLPSMAVKKMMIRKMYEKKNRPNVLSHPRFLKLSKPYRMLSYVDVTTKNQFYSFKIIMMITYMKFLWSILFRFSPFH